MTKGRAGPTEELKPACLAGALSVGAVTGALIWRSMGANSDSGGGEVVGSRSQSVLKMLQNIYK